jgi:hypothetical protein
MKGIRATPLHMRKEGSENLAHVLGIRTTITTILLPLVVHEYGHKAATWGYSTSYWAFLKEDATGILGIV